MELTALTLNCWGIAGVSKDRILRMEAIAKELSSGKYDVVFLQEVWVEDDFWLIADKVIEVLPHSHYFHSGVIGGGVCIFSKAKIIDVFFYPWSLNGYIHKVQHGDWFGGKGVGLCTVLHEGFRINLYVTHLHAEYNPGNDEYRAHRVVQAFDTSQLVRLTQKSADICILGGDLNTEPDSLAYRIMLHNTPLNDSFYSTGKLEDEGMTSETPFNSYTASSSLQSCPAGKRIDYILSSSREGIKVEVLDCFLPLPSRIQDLAFSYSDHEAVCARLRVTKSREGDTNEENESRPEQIKALEEAVSVCEVALCALDSNKRFFYLLLSITAVLLISLPHHGLERGAFYNYLLLIAHIVFGLVGAFFLVMATVWNRIERHAILAGKLGMSVRLKCVLLK